MKKKSLEFCVTDLEGAKVAAAHGANRIELCVDLAIGGLTPSTGLIEGCAAIIETHVLIRPRPGNFNYAEDEIEVMRADFMQASLAGAKGVVFGCLNENGDLALEQNVGLISFAETLSLTTTFHRAFDQVNDPIKAFDQLVNWEVDRLLTSGHESSAIAGIDLLESLVKKNGSDDTWAIELMAGGSVSPKNAEALLNIGMDALHCSIHKKMNSAGEMGERLEYDLVKVSGMLDFF